MRSCTVCLSICIDTFSYTHTPPPYSLSSLSLPTQAPEERRRFDVLSFMKHNAPEGAAHGVMPIAAANLWLGTYKQ